MKKRLAEFLVRLLRNFISQVMTAVIAWLLDGFRKKWREHWRERHDRKRDEQEKAAREKQRAEAAGDTEAAKVAGIREAAAARDADLIREMGEAGEHAIESMTAEAPRAIDQAVDAAAHRSRQAISQLGSKPLPSFLEGPTT